MLLLPVLLSLASLVHALTAPLHTSSRWILDSNNQRVKLRCVNWATHLEANTPEGLQHRPIEDIATMIASYGFNCVRLTWSIELALNPDVSVKSSFEAAADAFSLPHDPLLALYNDAVAHNPFVQGTVMDAFTATVDALADAGLGIILDNHVSKPSWCCNLTDGNGWWGDDPNYYANTSRFFNTDDWLTGLSTMAAWAKDKPAVIGIGVRNEIRGIPVLQDTLGTSRTTWRDRVPRGITAIHDAHPGLLAIVGGTLGGTNYSFLRSEPLDRSAWPDRVVYEYHIYSYSVGYATGTCWLFEQEMGAAAGYLLTQGEDYTGPLWVSEFGFGMTGGTNSGLSDGDWAYFDCLRGYLEGNDADWSIWAVQGDYYVRDGIVSHDESYGLLSSDWSGLRNPDILSLLSGMMAVTQGP